MGIKNLSKLLKRHAPEAIQEVGLADLSGSVAAFDVPIFMYKFKFSSDDPVPSFLRLVDSCDSFNITPIFVFDGACSPAKMAELEKRREERERTRKKLEEVEQRLRNFQGPIHVKREMHIERLKLSKRVKTVPCRRDYMNLRECLRRHEMRIVEADGDAEKECARLVSRGEASIVVSEDFDTLPYLAGMGGKGSLVTGFSTPKMTRYDAEGILTELGFTEKQFIDLCILCGCDFSCKIKGIAIFRAFGLIRQHGDIETVLENLDRAKYTVPECFQFEVARLEFAG